MMVIASVALIISSETMRTKIENVFADASLWLAENFKLVVISVLAIAALSLILSAVTGNKNKRLPPVVATPIPFIGSILKFVKDPVGFTMDAYAKYGDVFTLNLQFEKITFFVGAEAQSVFFKNGDDIMDQGAAYKYMTPIFGEGIIYDASPKRRVQEKQYISSFLRTSKMKTYVDKFILESNEFFKTFPDEGVIDIKHEMGAIIMNCAARALMGNEIRENLYDEVLQLYEEIDAGITPIGLFFPKLPLPNHRRRDAARKKLAELFGGVIRKRRSEGIVKDDLLQVYMDAQFKGENGPLSDDRVAGLMIAVLFAGHHTSSITAAWCILELLNSPDLLQRVIAEIKDVVGERPVVYDDLSKLTFLHLCIKETLRLHPPLIFLFRRVMKDVEYKGVTIPAGHLAAIGATASGRVPETYSNADKFDPDRFLPPREEDKAPFSYIGFGAGMHACIGQQYAFLQLKTVLVTFLQAYHLEPTQKGLPEHDYASVVVGPKGNPGVRIKRQSLSQRVK